MMSGDPILANDEPTKNSQIDLSARQDQQLAREISQTKNAAALSENLPVEESNDAQEHGGSLSTDALETSRQADSQSSLVVLPSDLDFQTAGESLKAVQQAARCQGTLDVSDGELTQQSWQILFAAQADGRVSFSERAQILLDRAWKGSAA
jgi:hypothetical protein